MKSRNLTRRDGRGGCGVEPSQCRWDSMDRGAQMWLEGDKEPGAGLQQYLEAGSMRVSTEGQVGSVGWG